MKNYEIQNTVLKRYYGEDKVFSVPDGVKVIGIGCFSDNSIIECVILPEGVEAIYPSAFKNCKNLKQIIFPSTLKFIEEYAFCKCTALKDFTLPNNLEKIGKAAFMGCPLIESVTIPNKTSVIGIGAFLNCTLLKNINLPNTVINMNYKTFYNTAYYKNNSNWENGILYIGKHLVHSKKEVKTVFLKKDTIDIADEAFYHCTIDELRCNKNLELIGRCSFDGAMIKKLYLNEKVFISNYSFQGAKIIYLELNATQLDKCAFFRTSITELYLKNVKKVSTTSFKCSEIKRLCIEDFDLYYKVFTISLFKEDTVLISKDGIPIQRLEFKKSLSKPVYANLNINTLMLGGVYKRGVFTKSKIETLVLSSDVELHNAFYNADVGKMILNGESYTFPDVDEQLINAILKQ